MPVKDKSAPVSASIGRSPTVALLDEVQRQKARGVNILNLSGGEPDFTTPEHLIARRPRRSRGDTHYTPSRGLRMREAIAAKAGRQQHLCRSGDRRHSDGLGEARHAHRAGRRHRCRPRVLLPSPTWVSYGPMISLPWSRRRGPARPARELRARRRAARSGGHAAYPGDPGQLAEQSDRPPARPASRRHRHGRGPARLDRARRRDLRVIRYGGRTHLSLAAWPGCPSGRLP